MKLIGLTGGIGSGKSTVANIFEALSVPVFRADEAGRSVLATDAQVISEVKALLGDEVYDNAEPNRALIAERVFGDKALLEKLNKMIHPAVGRKTEEWIAQLNDRAAYAIKEAAILFESGAAKECDAVINVEADEDMRIQRVCQRDGVEEEQVRARMRQQWNNLQRKEASDFTITNNGETSVMQQVLSIHQTLIS